MISHCSTPRIHLATFPASSLASHSGRGMRQCFTAVLMVLLGLQWRTEFKKASEDTSKESEVNVQPQHFSLSLSWGCFFPTEQVAKLHSVNGCSSDHGHQCGWCKSGGHVLYLSRQTSYGWQSVKVFNKGCCLNLGLAQKKQESMCPKAYLFHSAVSASLIGDISPYSSHHGNGSHLSRRTFPWTTLTFSVDAAFLLLIFTRLGDSHTV